MAELRIRDVNEFVVCELKERAKREGISLGTFVRELLSREATRPRQALLERLQDRHEAFRREHGLLPDSTPDICDERDRWS